ncbi:MAG: hypothetical protein FWC32_00750 [Firmicutes bacterium]|nr:hypothetical protein [Bacillota bacterium]
MKIVMWMFITALFLLTNFMLLPMRLTVLGVFILALLAALVMLLLKTEQDEIKDRKRKGRIQLTYFLMAVVLLNTAIIINPLRRQPTEIRAALLGSTTIGMTIEEVADVINGHGRWTNVDPLRDILHSIPDYIDIYELETRDARQAMETRLGSVRYFIFLNYEARATWLFDANGRLVDIYVRKDFRA